MRWFLVSIASGIVWLLLWSAPIIGQGYQCRTSPVGGSNTPAVTTYCSSEAFVTKHFPSSTTAGDIATFADGSGQVLQDGGSPSNIGPTNSQIGNYTITNTSGDCGGIILASGGFNTITLNAVSGFPDKCLITVKNTEVYTGSTGRAKKLSGFPSDIGSLLWPLQTVQVKLANGVWQTVINPGRWKPPTFVTCHVDINGSNTNDCLASGSSNAVGDAQTAWNIAQYQFDHGATTTRIVMACSQTHTVALNMGGTPLGTNLVQLSPDGNCSFTWTNSGPCISINDLAELDLRLNQYGGSGAATFGCNTSNAANSGNIYLHNQVVLDLEGTPIWNPAGANDNFLYCDGQCQFTVANGITQGTAAAGNVIIYMSAGGHGTQSGTISPSAAGTANSVFHIFGSAILNRGTSDGAGWTSIGASIVSGSSTLVTNGTTTAGGVTVGPSSVSCAALNSTC